MFHGYWFSSTAKFSKHYQSTGKKKKSNVIMGFNLLLDELKNRAFFGQALDLDGSSKKSTIIVGQGLDLDNRISKSPVFYGADYIEIPTDLPDVCAGCYYTLDNQYQLRKSVVYGSDYIEKVVN